METWILNFECAKRCLKRKLSLKEINSLIANGITEISESNIVELCKNKNIELTIITTVGDKQWLN